jgi:hypothetical protein
MKKRRKSTTTISTGKSKAIVNDLGSEYLRDRHQVGIVRFEKSNIGRAVVVDQHLIDRLHSDNFIDDNEHNVCDKYLEVTAKGMHLSSPGFAEKKSTGKYYSAPVPKSCILIRVQRHLIEFCGRQAEKRFWRLMVRSPKSVNELDVEIVKSCAGALTDFYPLTADSPLEIFQRALSNRMFSRRFLESHEQ